MFHVVSGLIALYVIWRFVLPLPWQRPGKIVLACLLFLVAEHHLVTRTFFGTMSSPEVPATVLLVLGWAFGTLILLAALLLLRDVLGGLTRPLSRRMSDVLFGSSGLRLALGVFAAVLAGIGVWQAVRVPEVRTVEIQLPGLPAALDGFTVVQLTDLHASRLLQGPWMEAVVARANALSPDLTLVTGDLVDGTPEARADDVRPLADLQARHGVFAIPGNHEYYAEYRGWMAVFARLGLRMLPNAHVVLPVGDSTLVVAGVTDPVAARFGLPEPDIDAALANAGERDVTILMSHRPVGAHAYAQAGADLQLSGHTHGGQVLGLHLITQLANEGYVSGLYEVGAMQLYVSNGAGLWNGFPIRLGQPSEITQLVLRAIPVGD